MKVQLRAALAVAALAIPLVGCTESSGDAPPDITGPSFSAAGPPMTAGGTGEITALRITSNRTVGKNRIQTRELAGTVTGGLVGTFFQEVRGVIHDNGMVTFQGTLEFEGEVAGCPLVTGFTARITGRGLGGPAPVTDVHWTVISSTGGWVSGTGTIQQVGAALTYEGRYLCR